MGVFCFLSILFAVRSSAKFTKEKLPPLPKSSPRLLLRSFGTVTHSSPVWSLTRSKKESDTSSVEDTGQAYVVGKDADLWRMMRLFRWSIALVENVHLCSYKSRDSRKIQLNINSLSALKIGIVCRFSSLDSKEGIQKSNEALYRPQQFYLLV